MLIIVEKDSCPPKMLTIAVTTAVILYAMLLELDEILLQTVYSIGTAVV